MTLRPRVTGLAIAALVLVGLGVFGALGFKAGPALSEVEGASPSSTNVFGLISTDTTWTAANSPYIVTSSVLVQQGVTLTIEPGVEVKFNTGLALQVNGELIARGSGDAQVVFTSNAASPASGDWGFILFTDSSVDAVYDATGDYVSGSILEHCTIEFAGSGVDYALRILWSGPLINHCTIKDNAGSGIKVEEGVLKIMNSTIAGNTAAGGGAIYIFSSIVDLSDNIITGNTALYGGGIEITHNRGSTVTLSGNTITRNKASVDGGAIYIGCCVVGVTLSDNTIIGNISPTSTVRWGSSGSALNNNFFENDAPYLVYNARGNNYADAKMRYNWWGTTDTTDIAESIYDWFDDNTKAIVDYIPFLTQPNTGAPVSPPLGLAATGDADALTIALSWNANPESDVVGYKVHYDTGDSSFPYLGTGAASGDSPVDVGNVTSVTLSGLTPWVTYYIAITAYDSDGNESWYSEEVAVVLQPGVDTTPPYTTGDNPARGATGVPVDTNIVVHVRDDASGVNQSTIVLTVEGVDVTSQSVITGGTGDYTG